MNCEHKNLETINITIIESVLNRKIVLCKDCQKVIETKDYSVVASS